MAIRQTPLEDQRTGNYRSSQSPVKRYNTPPAWLSKVKDKGEKDNQDYQDYRDYRDSNNPFDGAVIGSGSKATATRANPNPYAREQSRYAVHTPTGRFSGAQAGGGATQQEAPAWLQPISGGRYSPASFNTGGQRKKEDNMTPEEALAKAQAIQNPASFMGQNDPHHIFNPAIDRYAMGGPNTPWWPTGAAAPVTMPTAQPVTSGGYYPYSFGSKYGGNWGRGGGYGGGGYSSSPAWANYYLRLNSWNI